MSTREPASWRLNFGLDRANIPFARRFVRVLLAGHVPEAVAVDLELATSELITNAVEHGSNGTVDITITWSDATASIVVTSPGASPGVVPVTGWTIAEANQPTGRGLGIVRSVADDVDVVQSADHLTVAAHRFFASTEVSGPER